MSLLRLLREHAREGDAFGRWSDKAPATPPVVSDEAGPALYVATDLSFREEPCGGDEWQNWEDVEKDGACYRRLDPYYYAWLGHKMELAKDAAREWAIDPRAYERLRGRFHAVDEWARKHFTEEAVRRAQGDLRPEAYLAPRAGGHLYPADGVWRFRRWVSPRSVALVDGIRDRAVPLGWTEKRLYQNRGRHPFPFGDDYGLVCFLRWDEEPGETTAQRIEIVRTGAKGPPMRFHNPDVEQSWLKKSHTPPAPTLFERFR